MTGFISLQEFAELAKNAYRMISFEYETRGANTLESCEKELNEDLNMIPDGEKSRYIENYKRHLSAWLSAKSRCASTMITGASNFNVRRNEKANDAEQKRVSEFVEWRKSALNAISKRVEAARPQAEKDAEAWAALRDDLLSSIATIIAIDKGEARGCTRALFVSSICGKVETYAKRGDVAIVQKAVDLVNEINAKQKKAVITARNKFFALPALAEKNRAKTEERATAADAVVSFDGGNLVKNYQEDRLQIIFDAKPSAEVIEKLKRNGFRWSPRFMAWQRQLTVNAFYAAAEVVPVTVAEMRAAKADEPQPVEELPTEAIPVEEPIKEEPQNIAKDSEKYHGMEAAQTVATLSTKPESMPDKYPFLVPMQQGADRIKCAADNMRRHLKHAFPGVVFSVRKDGYDTYYIRWQDGPCAAEVDAIAKLYEGRDFDGMQDIETFKRSEFTDTFGAAGYVFTSRSFSAAAIQVAKADILRDYPDFETSSVINCEDVHILAGDCRHTAGGVLHLNDLVHGRLRVIGFTKAAEAPAVVAPAPEEVAAVSVDAVPEDAPNKPEPQKAAKDSEKYHGLELVDYSEKSVALFGDSKAIKEKLKALNGRFNPALNHNGTKRAGWIFAKRHESALSDLLIDLNTD